MSLAPSPNTQPEESIQDKETMNSSTLTALEEPHSPISVDAASEKPAEEGIRQNELTVQSALQVLGGFMLLFNSYVSLGGE
jgi:hypothetical protein